MTARQDTTALDLVTGNLLHAGIMLYLNRAHARVFAETSRTASSVRRHMRPAQLMSNLVLIELLMSASLCASSPVSIGMDIQETISSTVCCRGT